MIELDSKITIPDLLLDTGMVTEKTTMGGYLKFDCRQFKHPEGCGDGPNGKKKCLGICCGVVAVNRTTYQHHACEECDSPCPRIRVAIGLEQL